MARNTVYIVREEMEGGYMPDSVSYFATKREAQSFARDRAASARDDGYTLTPSDASDYTLDLLIVMDAQPRSSFEDSTSDDPRVSIYELIDHLNDYSG